MTNTHRLEQLIISSILGDGSFTKPHRVGGNAKLSVAHCLKQRELIELKHTILRDNNLANTLCYNKIVNDRYKNGFIEELRFKSKACKLFAKIRKDCYDKFGNKRIVKKYISKLDSFGLALWYMDDGNVTNSSFQINTQSFSLEEKEYLQRVLSREFGLKTTIHSQGQIYILQESSYKFIVLVKPFTLVSMMYKLIPYDKRVLYKVEELQEH